MKTETIVDKVNGTVLDSATDCNIPKEYHPYIKLIVWQAIGLYKYEKEKAAETQRLWE